MTGQAGVFLFVSDMPLFFFCFHELEVALKTKTFVSFFESFRRCRTMRQVACRTVTSRDRGVKKFLFVLVALSAVCLSRKGRAVCNRVGPGVVNFYSYVAAIAYPILGMG